MAASVAAEFLSNDRREVGMAFLPVPGSCLRSRFLIEAKYLDGGAESQRRLRAAPARAFRE
jgi:hypothetical protein